MLNITTRSGSNDWHGTLFEFFRNDKLNANDFFSNKNNLGKSPLRWNQFGGNVAGPIKRDKVFFFFNYEGAKVRRQPQVTGNVPTEALLVQLTPEIRNTLTTILPAPTNATSNPLIGQHVRNDRSTNDEQTFLTRVDVFTGPAAPTSGTATTIRTTPPQPVAHHAHYLPHALPERGGGAYDEPGLGHAE